MSRFAITRTSGKSDAEVLAERISRANPGDLLSYSELAGELGEGSGRAYERADVQASVARAERKIATELSRALVNVRGQGYRIALASEHQMIAGRKKDRAETMLKRGLTIMQNVDWAAMDENSRKAHEGQLMVIGAVHAAMVGLDRRMQRIEKTLSERNGK